MLDKLNEKEEMLLKELDEIRFKKIVNFIDTNKVKINDLQFNNQILDDLDKIKQTFKELITKF